MVPDCACCSDETRAYKATRNGFFVAIPDMMLNLPHVVLGWDPNATSDATAAPKRRPGDATTSGAPIRRRDQDTRIPSENEANCEPTCEPNATEDETRLEPPCASFGK